MARALRAAPGLEYRLFWFSVSECGEYLYPAGSSSANRGGHPAGIKSPLLLGRTCLMEGPLQPEGGTRNYAANIDTLMASAEWHVPCEQFLVWNTDYFGSLFRSAENTCTRRGQARPIAVGTQQAYNRRFYWAAPALWKGRSN